MDGSLVLVSIIDLLMSLISDSSPKIFGILRVSIKLSTKKFHFIMENNDNRLHYTIARLICKKILRAT